MIRTAFLSTSIITAMLLSGCDNTAKVPEPQTKAEATAVSKPIRIGYSDWPGFVAWQVAI